MSPARTSRPNLILLVIAGASLMIVLDATIVNIALPSMGRYFHRNSTDMTWTVNAYTLAFGGLLLLGGRAGDLFGRRRMLMLGLALFSLGSLAAGLAFSFEFLLAGRAVQGVGAAIASPTALSLIAIEFPEGALRNRAIAVYSTVSGVGAVFGLLLGGALTEYVSWRWVLFVNVPLGFVLVVATWYVVPTSPRPGGRIDWVGALASIAGVGGLVYAFIRTGDDGWGDLTALGWVAASIAVLVVFGFYELFVAAEPMLPIRLLRDRNRSSAYLVILVVGAVLFGLLYFITFYLQGVLGYSALKAGFALLPGTLIVVIATQTSAKLMPILGTKRLVIFGTVVLTVALGWLSTIGPDAAYLTMLLPATLIGGIGIGAVLVPLTTIVLTGVPKADAGLASGVLNVGQQLGGSLGLAVIASAAATEAGRAATSEGHRMLDQYGLSEHVLNFAILGRSLQDGSQPSAAASADAIARHAINSVQASAFGAGFQTAAIFGAAAIALALTGLVGRRARTAQADAEMVSTQ